MNKRNLSILIAAITASVLVCCSKQSETDPKIPENGDGQYQSLELASVRESEFQSKAVVDGETFPQDGHIGLFLFADAAASQTYGEGYENVDYSYNSQKGKWTASPSIKVGSTPGYLYGYYPYKAGTQQQPVNIKAIQVASSFNGDDVMYATPQDPITDQTAGNVSVTMKHALARVAITVVNKGYTGDAKLQSIKFAGAEIAESGTLNAVDGTITAAKAQAVTLTVPEASQAIATGSGSVYECLLVPSAVKADRQNVALTLKIDGQEKSANLTGDNGVIFGSGVKSRIIINLSNSGISVGEVSIDDWQTVEVGGHKVTVKVADDIAAGDIMFAPYVDGNNVIIKASSFQSKRLICNVGGDAQCERVVTNDKFTFTISEISSDIEAVLGYAQFVTLTVTSDSNGKVWIGDDKNKTTGQFEPGEQVVVHAAPNDNCNLFRWIDNNKELDRTITIGATDVTYSAKFIHKDAIPGLFTVDANKKQVFFSKGNLYCSGVTFTGDGTVFSMKNAQWGFEANQYDTTPSSSGDRVDNHISHFMWCDNADNAIALKYDNGWNGSDKSFFAAKNFTVNGYSGWGVLTGGTNGEWAYLLNTRKTIYGKDTDVENRRYAAVKVNGMAGLLLFPDDFSSWPSGAGDEPQTFNTNSSDWNDRKYTAADFIVLQNNGCVFLPAAGYRSDNAGGRNPAGVSDVGDDGYYWSASPYGTHNAFGLDFGCDDGDPSSNDARFRAQSVRLVTESK